MHRLEEINISNELNRSKFYRLLRELAGFETDNEKYKIMNISKTIPGLDFARLIRENFDSYIVESEYPNGFYIETEDAEISVENDAIQQRFGLFSESTSISKDHYNSLLSNRKSIQYKLVLTNEEPVEEETIDEDDIIIEDEEIIINSDYIVEDKDKLY